MLERRPRGKSSERTRVDPSLCFLYDEFHWAISSAVRAFGLHPKGRPFESDSAHHAIFSIFWPLCRFRGLSFGLRRLANFEWKARQLESEADLLSPLFTPLDVLNQLLRAARAQRVKEKRTRPFAGVNGELCKEEGKRKEQSIKRLDARHC